MDTSWIRVRPECNVYLYSVIISPLWHFLFWCRDVLCLFFRAKYDKKKACYVRAYSHRFFLFELQETRYLLNIPLSVSCLCLFSCIICRYTKNHLLFLCLLKFFHLCANGVIQLQYIKDGYHEGGWQFCAFFVHFVDS